MSEVPPAVPEQGGRRILGRIIRHRLTRRLAMAIPGSRRIAFRYVAGESTDRVIRTIVDIHDSGLSATVNHIGTHSRTEAQAQDAREAILTLLDQLEATGLSTQVSVKLTQIGLDVDAGLCRANIVAILEKAVRTGVFVRVDMEESQYADATIALVEALHGQYGADVVGIAIQAYLRGHFDDVERLAKRGIRIRLVKGGYWESADRVLQDRTDINAAFSRDLAILMRWADRPAIATHDSSMISLARVLARENGRSPDDFEFEMLYGICNDLARRLGRKGYRVRIYVPYGQDWYAYVLGCIRLASRQFVEAVRRPLRGRSAQSG